MISREQQLKSNANFIDENGRIYLMVCQECQSINEEPYASQGRCNTCGWDEELAGELQSIKEKSKPKRKSDGKQRSDNEKG
jgi:PHP family Zn ribbon phosphoesterase